MRPDPAPVKSPSFHYTHFSAAATALALSPRPIHAPKFFLRGGKCVTWAKAPPHQLQQAISVPPLPTNKVGASVWRLPFSPLAGSKTRVAKPEPTWFAVLIGLHPAPPLCRKPSQLNGIRRKLPKSPDIRFRSPLYVISGSFWGHFGVVSGSVFTILKNTNSCPQQHLRSHRL